MRIDACQFCRYWNRSKETPSTGECRVSGPNVEPAAQGFWPITRYDDWCGEQESNAIKHIQGNFHQFESKAGFVFEPIDKPEIQFGHIVVTDGGQFLKTAYGTFEKLEDGR